MRSIFLCLVLLLVSPVLSHTNEDKNEGQTFEDSSTNITSMINEKDETKLFVPDRPVESTDVSNEEISASNVERKQSRKKKRPNNKQRQNRINQLRQKGKRPNGRKRRPQNDKKGYGKKNKRPVFKAIRYLPRSSNTDQLNKALDEMLEYMSQNLASVNSTFSLKLNNFREDMKISPWAFVALNKTEIAVVEGKIRRGRTAGNSGKETIEENASDASESDEDDGDDGTNLEVEAEIEIVTESIGEEFSIVSEKTEVKTTEEENEDDDDDVETVTEISLDFKQLHKSNATQFYRTQKPSPVVLDDGTIEYNLQLLSENDINHRKLGFTENIPEKFQDDDGRQAKKLDGKGERGSSRRNSRRPNAKVEGIHQIQRVCDVLIGLRGNSTTHTIDTELTIGPLQFFMDKNAGFHLQQSRVSMAPLSARLQITEVGGKLVGVRLKPTKIRPDEALVTFRLNEEGRIPTYLETARLVTYLSQETTKIWNSGYLLRRLKRQFKQLFIDKASDSKKAHSKSQDARKLVETLTLSAFGAAIKGDTV